MWHRGSPPHMRGKDIDDNLSKENPGITPAYAGKSLGGLKMDKMKLGSPPHMRGKEK